ncbi:type II toxin-antitoxin system RelE/ParE family toxin [Chitinophaga rupis]|uniref:type II toxin-antitoxin system RelE/ParE family toxin n=1 Tax=Chitinophaga rupis TaxID=573321 RepID=UPI001EE3FB2E|nr:type II toxin-antitoxin system RelE/ParE family toxin [Chitinophaga rupis]
MANRNIVWGKVAFQQFNAAIEYISEDSVQNAEKVRAEILERIGRLSGHPEIYPPDKYKLNNDGNYRAFECQRLRIAYYTGPHEIRILRIRHTYREPLTY